MRKTPACYSGLVRRRKNIRNDERRIALEAKVLTYLAFRQGPVEDLHAAPKSKITEREMRDLNRFMVDSLYVLLRLKARDPRAYWQTIEVVGRSVRDWDDPFAERVRLEMRLKELDKLTIGSRGSRGSASPRSGKLA